MKFTHIVLMILGALGGAEAIAAQAEPSKAELAKAKAESDKLEAFVEKKISYDELLKEFPPKVGKLNFKEVLSGLKPLKGDTGYTFIPIESAEYFAGKRQTHENKAVRQLDFSFSKDAVVNGKKLPRLINPKAINALTCNSCNNTPPYIAVDPNSGNAFYIEENVIVWEGEKEQYVGFYKEDGTFSEYKHLATLANGIHVLNINKNTGGNLTYGDLYFVIFEEILIFEHNKVEKKIILRLLGSYSNFGNAFYKLYPKGNKVRLHYIAFDRSDDFYWQGLTEISFE